MLTTPCFQCLTQRASLVTALSLSARNQLKFDSGRERFNIIVSNNSTTIQQNNIWNHFEVKRFISCDPDLWRWLSETASYGQVAKIDARTCARGFIYWIKHSRATITNFGEVIWGSNYKIRTFDIFVNMSKFPRFLGGPNGPKICSRRTKTNFKDRGSGTISWNLIITQGEVVLLLERLHEFNFKLLSTIQKH